MADLPDLPTGTVTFLFTDLEGSTRLLEAHPAGYREAVRRHHALLRGAVEAQGGVVFETVGDAVYAAFARPTAAVAAALAGQLALRRADWGELGAGALKARMALHTGEVERHGGHYFGGPLYRAGRLLPAAHGGQVVLTAATAALVRDALPARAGLRDLGEHRLKDLARPERVAQLLHPDLPAAFPPLRSLESLLHNLPLQLTSFVGREREVAEVARLLGTTRLLTLTGPGGCGKTRLALQVAAEASEAYPDGVWLAELGALADPALVPAAVAAAVGVREEPGWPLLATLTDALRPKRLLVALDNCEHLLEACAALAEALLRACPHLRVLATSREALGIAGEVAWRVPSLRVPDASDASHPPPGARLRRSEAVRLFVDRAVAVRPGFRVTAGNAPAIAQLCARLDGIPLALELAAARVRVLPPDQLLARLEDRFRLLTGGSRTAVARHQTLRAAVDWSYALLAAPEQTLFARLAVFAGGWTLEAAEAVGAGDGIASAEVLDLLTRLADKSLVVVDEQPDGTARYRLLETLRQYAEGRLVAAGEAERVRRRHAAYCLALAERAELQLRGVEQVRWLHRLETERDNLRAALGWLIPAARAVPPGHAPPGAADAAAQGVRLAAALWRFWHLRGADGEGLEWLEACLALPGAGGRTPARAKALAAASMLLLNQGAPGRTRALAEEALAISQELGDRPGEVFALLSLGHAAYVQPDRPASVAAFKAALARSREAGDPWSTAFALWGLGTALLERDAAAAEAYLAQSLAVSRQLRDRHGIARALHNLATLTRRRGDRPTFRALVDECVATERELGNPDGVAWALEHLAEAAQLEGDRATERAHREQSLALRRDVGNRRMIPRLVPRLAELTLDAGDPAAARRLLAEGLRAWPHAGDQGVAASLAGFAALAAAQGQPRRAARLAGAARALGAAHGASFDPDLQACLERLLRRAGRSGGAATHAAATQEGRALPLEQAVAEALEDAPAPA